MISIAEALVRRPQAHLLSPANGEISMIVTAPENFCGASIRCQTSNSVTQIADAPFFLP